MNSSGLGNVVVDLAGPGSGFMGPVNGGVTESRNPTYMSIDHNIKVKADNTSLLSQINNPISANAWGQQVIDKSTFNVYPTNRENINPTNECQANLKGHELFANTSYLDGQKTTTKETTHASYSGQAGTSLVNSINRTHYTTTDGTGGATNVATNKNLVSGYTPTAGSHNKMYSNIGDVNFKELDNDMIRTAGSGTYNRAAPEMTRTGIRFAGQIGTLEVNPNRLQQESNSRTDASLIQPLLNNGYSVYNTSNNLEYPEFYLSSRNSLFNPVPRTNLNKEPIKNNYKSRSIPVYNSSRNPNQVIVQNTQVDMENPLLFGRPVFN
jgi:hypothetical protein